MGVTMMEAWKTKAAQLSQGRDSLSLHWSPWEPPAEQGPIFGPQFLPLCKRSGSFLSPGEFTLGPSVFAWTSAWGFRS